MNIELVQRRFERERRARREAERILEAKSMELYRINEELRETASRLEQKQQELEQALDREKEINGQQRQFVSMVSHEFRTPLAIIDGNAHRLLRRAAERLTEKECMALSKVRGSVVRLTDLMESVLSAAQLDDGCIRFEPVPCSLKAMVEEIAGSYREIKAGRRIGTDLEHLPDEIVADPKLLRQVISNLLSNALKYSPEDSEVDIRGWSDEEKGVILALRDEGVGIPEAEQAKLFERFFRASTSIGITGTGIGLHLTAHLVQLHGGMIECESAEGMGSTFRIVLPIRPEAPAGVDTMRKAS